jgi:hypothetical protein
MKNDIISLKLKADLKNQSIDFFKPSHQSPRNNKILFQNRKKPNTIIKETMRRNKENSLRKHNNNLNSFTNEKNNLQSLIYQSETYKTNINSNILNNILPKNTVLSTANKKTQLNPQNKKNEKKKPTVNLSKNIEEIIKTRILDNKNVKTNSLQKRNNNHNKKLKFANSHAVTSKKLEGNKSFDKKEITVNKNSSIISNNNRNENYKNKYFETRRVNMCDKSNTEDYVDSNIDKDKNDDDEEKEKLFHMEYFNSNTDNIKNENMGNIFDNANSFRGINYDYDSCFEDENRPKRLKVVKSLNRSKLSKNISNDKEEFYTYDTINQEFISIIEDNKNSLDKKDNNISNEIIDKTNYDVKPQEKNDISKDNENDENENKMKQNDKKVNQNDSIVNTNDFSTNTNINSERHNLSNNSAPKIKESNKSKKDVENIKKIISNTIKNINSSLNTSHVNEEKNIQENSKNYHINLTEIKPINYLKPNDSSIKPSSILDSLNNNSNQKPNIYAPKKVGNHLTVKNNINDELLESNKKKNNNINIIIDENSEKENSDKEKNIYSHRITYTKKIPSIYIQKNFTSSKIESDREKDKEYSINELKKKNIKNRLNFPKLNSSYEGTNNLQMNNIFMNNNVFNNNFNYPLGIGLSDPYINNAESSNNFICPNNACYKFKNNNIYIMILIILQHSISSKMLIIII